MAPGAAPVPVPPVAVALLVVAELVVVVLVVVARQALPVKVVPRVPQAQVVRLAQPVRLAQRVLPVRLAQRVPQAPATRADSVRTILLSTILLRAMRT